MVCAMRNLLAVAVLLFGAVGTGRAASVTFDEAGNQLSLFNILDSSNVTTATGYTEASSAGVGLPASVGVTHITGGSASSVSAVYTGEVFNLTSTSPFTVSAFFRETAFTTAVSTRTFWLGLSQGTNTGFNSTTAGTEFLAGRISATSTAGSYDMTIGTKQAGSSGVTMTVGTVTLNLTDYYKLTMTFQRSVTVNAIKVALLLEDYGPDGISGPTTVSSVPLTNYFNSPLYVDSSTYAGFAGEENLTNNYDNFSTTGGTSVPEPASSAFLAAGGLALFARRRRLT